MFLSPNARPEPASLSRHISNTGGIDFDILSLILSHLGPQVQYQGSLPDLTTSTNHLRTLKNAATVSRLWSYAATPVLWFYCELAVPHSPDYQALQENRHLVRAVRLRASAGSDNEVDHLASRARGLLDFPDIAWLSLVIDIGFRPPAVSGGKVLNLDDLISNMPNLRFLQLCVLGSGSFSAHVERFEGTLSIRGRFPIAIGRGVGSPELRPYYETHDAFKQSNALAFNRLDSLYLGQVPHANLRLIARQCPNLTVLCVGEPFHAADGRRGISLGEGYKSLEGFAAFPNLKTLGCSYCPPAPTAITTTEKRPHLPQSLEHLHLMNTGLFTLEYLVEGDLSSLKTLVLYEDNWNSRRASYPFTSYREIRASDERGIRARKLAASCAETGVAFWRGSLSGLVLPAVEATYIRPVPRDPDSVRQAAWSCFHRGVCPSDQDTHARLPGIATVGAL